MGWIYMHSLDGHCGLRQYLDAQLSFEQPGGRNHVLRSALVRMRVYYAAVEHVSIDGTRQVWAAVCPVSYNRRARDGFIFGYKCMTEDMGPCEAECPKQIIDTGPKTLSPFGDVLANIEPCTIFPESRKSSPYGNTYKKHSRRPKAVPGPSGKHSEITRFIPQGDCPGHELACWREL